MEVRPLPGLEHLPYAELWLREADADALRAAGEAARALGKTGLEVWTTTRTPDVPAFLEARGFAEVRRYVISELDVRAAPEPGRPAFPVVTLAERPGLGAALYELARVAHADQPGRAGTRIGEDWFEWGLAAHDPEAFFVVLEDARLLGYGYLEEEEGRWGHGFTAVAREARGRGVAGAIKRAQIRWAKARGIPSLETATEVRLAQMRSLNERFGYRPLYEEVALRGPAA